MQGCLKDDQIDKQSPCFDILKQGLAFFLKALGLGLLLYLLSLTYLGNFIRCKLFDSQGCLPSISSSLIEQSQVTRDQMKRENFTTLGAGGSVSDNYTLIKCKIQISNNGFENTDSLIMTARAFSAQGGATPILVGYKVESPPAKLLCLPVFDENKKLFNIKGPCFSENKRWWKKEQVSISLIFRFTKKMVTRSLLLELRCQGCQVLYKKQLIHLN